MTTAELVQRIEALQDIQGRNRPTSAAWQAASDSLAPLFAEMAKRQEANGGERDWQKWVA